MHNTRTIAGLDYSTVDSLQRKRLLAFVNHFLSRTIDSMAIFSQACESKLSNIATKLKKVENSLILLECKLESVPELRHIGLEDKPECTDHLANRINNEVMTTFFVSVFFLHGAAHSGHLSHIT